MADNRWPVTGRSQIGGEWQGALNEQWPPNPRGFIDQPDPVYCWALVEWERDGVEWVEGRAIRWDQHHVLVSIGDHRCSTIGFWLRPGDVRRRNRDAAGADKPAVPGRS